MLGGFRLLVTLLIFATLSLTGLVATAWAADHATSPAAGPPQAKVEPVVDILHGHKITDRYRYLEDANNPETQTFVHDQLAYARSILDPLPGRDQIHQRLAQLLTIGAISTPNVAGPYYFYTRRDGTQNQAILYVRDRIDGLDRVLVDANQMAADGTIALDWWFPSEDGKYVAYGISSSG